MDYEINEKAYNKSVKYIEARMNGLNKTQSKVVAGYSAKSNGVAEQTKAYAVALNDILNNNTHKIRFVNDILDKKLEDGEVDKLTPLQVVDFQLKLAQIHKILTPQVTIKEETNKDGSKKITKWGQTSYLDSEAN